MIEIGDQTGPGRSPPQLLARLLAGSRHVVPGKHGKPAEKGWSFFRGDGFDRQFQASTNSFRNIAHRNALFRDRVIFGPWLGPFDRQPVEARHVKKMRRRPAIESVSDIRAHALFTEHHDRRGDEALRNRVMDLREAHDRHIDPIRGDSGRRLFRGRAGMHVGSDGRIVFLGRLTGHGVGNRGPGGHDRWPLGARKSRAERLDDPSIVLTVCDEFREVVVEGQVDDAVRSSGRLLEAVQILERPAIDLGAGGRQGRRLFIRTAEAQHLMACRDQFLDDGGADESRGSSDKHAHEQSLQSFVGDKSVPVSYSGKVVTLSWYNG